MTGRRLVLSGAGLMALLAVVAVASRAHKPGGGRSGGGAKVPPVLLEYLGVLALVIILVGGALAVFAFADNRRRKALAGETGRRRSLGGVAFGLLAVVLVLLLRRHAHGTTGIRPFGAFGPTGVAAKGATGSAAARAAHQQQTESDWLGAVILGSILLGLAAAIASAAAYRRSHGTFLEEEAALAAALDAVLADTLADLYAERDPRTAVINAYARMEQTFAAYRVPRDEAETSLEYVERVLDRLNVSGWAVRRLTLLFERAKYSSHEVDSTMKDDAIETLASVRAELEADEHEAVA
jgi:uncharacterized protein DUF4129